MIKKFLLLILSLLSTITIAKAQVITHLPGITHPRYQTSGYSNKLFFWFVKSKKETAHTPIIIWTSGGPGSSSLYGFFEENGPYNCSISSRKKPSFTISTTHADWSKFSDLIVFDQPVGIGLSFANQKQYPRSPAEGNIQYYQAIRAFFKSHPAMTHHPLYLAGESYGATYITLLAKKLRQHPIRHLRLEGLIMISPWIVPQTQYEASLPSLLQRHLISRQQYLQLQPYQKSCTDCNANKARCFAHCQQLDEKINSITRPVNLHDIATPHPTDWTQAPWVHCMNNIEVRKDIHAELQHRYYPMTNIWNHYGHRQLISRLPILKSLLKHNIKLLIISGYNDLSPSGYAGTENWLRKIDFDFKNKKNWIIGNIKLGSFTQSGRTRWLVVLNAGHTVPTYQPLIVNSIRNFTRDRERQ